MKYELTKNDYEDISSLIMISKQINSLYEELYQLELEGKKESEDYNIVIDRLKSTIFVEKNIYDRIGKSFEKNVEILNYLKSDDSETSNLQDGLFIFEQDLIISRILLNLYKNVMENSQNLLPDEMKLMLSLSGMTNNEINRYISISVNVRESIITDILNCLIAIIQKEENKNPSISKHLKKVKYTISYLYSKIENNLLEKKFKNEENPYMETMLIGQFYHWPIELIDKIKRMYILNFYNQILRLMLLLNDEDLKNDEILSKMIISQGILRTIFLSLDDETITDLKKEFIELIEELNSYNVIKNRQKIINMIIDIYGKVKSDRTIPKVILLKL